LPLDPRLTLAARLNLAGLLVEAGELQEAAHLCRQAIGAAPGLPLAWSQLGLVERRRGAIAAAIEAYREALRLDPDHLPSHQNLAVALLMAGDIAGCRAAFREAIARLRARGLDREAESLHRQAATMVRLHD
ncbi:MAG: tetratricopeptide repeat protein, partial [Cyanobium sp.]